MDLDDIVNHRHEFPLAVDLCCSSQTESLDPDRIGDVSEHRLYDSQPLAIDVSTSDTVDLSPHLLKRACRSFTGDAQSEIDLA